MRRKVVIIPETDATGTVKPFHYLVTVGKTRKPVGKLIERKSGWAALGLDGTLIDFFRDKVTAVATLVLDIRTALDPVNTEDALLAK